jgi:hypothetical protein
MKYSLFLLTALLLTSCIGKDHYNSYRQALEACNKWEKKGGKYQVIYQARSMDEVVLGEASVSKKRRKCIEEQKTNQFLGIEVNRKEGQKIYIDVDKSDSDKDMKERVSRNFYY